MTLRDEDVDSIRKFFKIMGALVNHWKGRLQIIVLDHAGRTFWGNLPGVKLAEEWRGDDALVPEHWFDVPSLGDSSPGDGH